MTQKELRNEFIRFGLSSKIETQIEHLNYFIKCFHDFIINHNEEASSNEKKDAKIILQMMYSKLIHLKKILEGVSHLNLKEPSTYPTIDPTIVTSLIRNIHETVCLFNIVYDSPDSEEKRKIVHNLWVSSGLKYRQRFSAFATTEENKQKADNELKEIEKIKTAIEDTSYYKGLDEQNQKKIQTKLKKKDYKVKLEDNNVCFLSWGEISKEFVINSNIFDELYTYFSLYAHPSHVSVFQFEDLIKVDDESNIKIINTNIRYCLMLSSIFLGDYIRLFPETKATYESRSEIEQIMLNFYNRILRGDDKSISDAWKKLG